jgi:hypothetical protein
VPIERERADGGHHGYIENATHPLPPRRDRIGNDVIRTFVPECDELLSQDIRGGAHEQPGELVRLRGNWLKSLRNGSRYGLKVAPACSNSVA